MRRRSSGGLLLDTPIPKPHASRSQFYPQTRRREATPRRPPRRRRRQQRHRHPATTPTQRKRTCTIGAEMDFATNLAPKRDPRKKTKPRNSAAAVGVIFIVFQLGGGWWPSGFLFFFSSFIKLVSVRQGPVYSSRS